ncbi:MAG: hypothetical protein GX430_03925 [Treponema sp.]|nr:hypothetical protein [Treponema sp.]
MVLKKRGFDSSTLTVFDLLGYTERGISLAFAYLLSKNKNALYIFLRYIGVDIRNSYSNYLKTDISVEHHHAEGRTDIEILQADEFHVIIECKVGANKVRRQRTQYLSAFHGTNQKVLCFITQVNDFNKTSIEGVSVRNIGWIELVNLFDGNRQLNDPLSSSFLKFAKRGYKMRNQKEILIQDVSERIELTNFFENQIYRRDVVFGSPLYFAPYFTRNADTKDGEGISYLSKVLGILTMRTKDLENYNDDLMEFAEGDKELIEKWKEGVNRYANRSDEHTYFFLGRPVRLKVPLRKDGGIEKGRGKNWIAAHIARNRCVSFEEFTRRIMMAIE